MLKTLPKNISPSHRAILDYLTAHPHVTSQEVADALYFKTCRFAYLNKYREDPVRARHYWASKALYNMAKQGLVRRIINVPGSGRIASVHTFLYEAVETGLPKSRVNFIDTITRCVKELNGRAHTCRRADIEAWLTEKGIKYADTELERTLDQMHTKGMLLENNGSYTRSWS